MELVIKMACMVVGLLVVLLLKASVLAVVEVHKLLVVLVAATMQEHLGKVDKDCQLRADMVVPAAAAGMAEAALTLIILVMMTAVAAVALDMYILHQLLLIIHLVVYLIRLII